MPKLDTDTHNITTHLLNTYPRTLLLIAGFYCEQLTVPVHTIFTSLLRETDYAARFYPHWVLSQHLHRALIRHDANTLKAVS